MAKLITPAAWDRCEDTQLSEADLAGQSCVVGIAATHLDDLCAVVCWFPGPCIVHPYLYVPESSLRRAKTQPWEFADSVVALPGWTLHAPALLEALQGMCNRYAVTAVVQPVPLGLASLLDPAQWPLVQQPVDWTAADIRAIKRLAKRRRLRHLPNAAFRQMLQNVVVKDLLDEDDDEPALRASRGNIDGVVAWLRAFAYARRGHDRN